MESPLELKSKRTQGRQQLNKRKDSVIAQENAANREPTVEENAQASVRGLDLELHSPSTNSKVGSIVSSAHSRNLNHDNKSPSSENGQQINQPSKKKSTYRTKAKEIDGSTKDSVVLDSNDKNAMQSEGKNYKDASKLLVETVQMTQTHEQSESQTQTSAGYLQKIASSKSKWQGRHQEIDKLNEFLCMRPSRESGLSSLFIVGGACTGKTSIVMEVVQQLELQYAYLTAAQYLNGTSSYTRSNANGGTGSKLFVLLARQLPNIDNATANKCTVAEALAIEIESRLPAKSLKPFVFILDDVDIPDVLESLSVTGWTAFKELKVKTKRNIKLILIGRGEDDRVHADLTLFFPAYSEKVCKRILGTQLCPANVSEIEFEKFLDFVFPHFWNSVTKDLDDLTYICEILWPAFAEQNHQLQTSASLPVATHTKDLRPAMKHLSRRVYFRDCEPVPDLMRRLAKCSEVSGSISQRLKRLTEQEMVDSSELPYHAKVLLMASYMGSFNPTEYDAVIFGAKKKRTKKRQKKIPNLSNEENNNAAAKTEPKRDDLKFVAPKAFPLERGRWLFRALFTDLVGAKQGEEAAFGVLRYLEVLCSLRLVVKCSDDAELTDVKIKCLASDEFCEAVAKNLGLDLTKYLARYAV